MERNGERDAERGKRMEGMEEWNERQLPDTEMEKERNTI